MGEVEIKVKIEKVTEHTYLDFKNGTILGMTINNTDLVNWEKTYKDDKILLSKMELLEEGQLNLIRLKFSCDFAKDGYGFTQTINGKYYYYHTQTEPDGASFIFPCFDFPGIKNNFKLYIVSDKEFSFCSNGKLKTKLKNDDFEETGELTTQSNNILEFIPKGMCEVEFEYVYDLAVHLFAFAFGNYVKKGGSLKIKDRKMYVRFFYTAGFDNLENITDFYLFNIADAINL